MTALREAHEEIGLDPTKVRILGRMQSIHTISNYIVTPIVGVIPWPVEVERMYLAYPTLRRMALESARTEATGYCKATRVEEIMDFARRMGWTRLGIAHCVGLVQEAKAARDIFAAGGFEVFTVCCKAGSIDKEKVGIQDAEKVRPGQYEAMCSPVGQAALLDKAGTEFNVVIGLCVGHDMLFAKHAKAPVSTIVCKDRVTGHNTVAVLYGQGFYYKRLRKQPLAVPEE